MTIDVERLQDRFRGCLLGLAVGDALGGLFEAQTSESITARFSTLSDLIDYPQEELWYTDDTQMMLGVAETLVSCAAIDESELCRAFVANYVPSRGYGRGTRVVIEAMEQGRDHVKISEKYFPGGSFGNGAAMRVAPVGLFFRDDAKEFWEQARLSALPTHRHVLGIEGAQLLALAVAHASNCEYFERIRFFGELIAACETSEYHEKLELAHRIREPVELKALGNQIEALHSVVTAIASFSISPESFESTIGRLIFLGGDTDTLAAMAGAISGAFLGAKRLSSRLLALLERSPQGRDYIESLADRLFERYTTELRTKDLPAKST